MSLEIRMPHVVGLISNLRRKGVAQHVMLHKSKGLITRRASKPVPRVCIVVGKYSRFSAPDRILRDILKTVEGNPQGFVLIKDQACQQ